ncbi:signal peptidase [Arthrobacter sp. ERGS1:01]|uniref:signal peptidase I n=1 Tax=Arthrobacter sp. ERGS1:01 TaxID=1704044 RepID=UPI0006B5B028|nr:signal peptidase I [Arthrobacter sp. ERGS1:01]ALE06405.1 signal peptidase [Arthrobacter sp. ERGS1:01]
MSHNVPGEPEESGHDGGGRAAETPSHGSERHGHAARHVRGAEPAEDAAGSSTAVRLGHGAWAWSKEIVTILAIAIVLSFLIKTFLFRAFFIPSGSMENTLEVGDRIFVNLLVPEPFALKRGDVVVFKDTQGWLAGEPTTPPGPFSWIGDAATFIGLAPDSSQQHLVKRVIGLPGDHVKCCDSAGKLIINGKSITEPYLFPGAAPSDTTFDITVPAGHLWVMGDHRNDSADSRAHIATGTEFVPISDVEGRAVVIAWPVTRWGILGNYPDVFKDVPAPQSTSQGSPQAVPSGQ